MTSIIIENLKVDITVFSIEGILQKTLNLPLKKGYWVYLTVENERGDRESFPLIDKDFKIKIFNEYTDAIQEMALRLNKYLN